MTKTGRTLGEYLDMGAAGVVALCHFIDKLDADSALVYEVQGTEAREWSSRIKTNSILADVFDAVRLFNFSFAKDGKTPPPYPRPWGEDKTERFGKDPIPIDDFDDWWNGGTT